MRFRFSPGSGQNPSGIEALNLQGAQNWSVAGGGSSGADSGLGLHSVTGHGDALNISMSDDADMDIDSITGVGDLTIAGADSTASGFQEDNGEVQLNDGLNAGGGPVTLDNIDFEPSGAVNTGPLTLGGSREELAAVNSVTSTGAVTIDSANDLVLSVDTAASQSQPELIASGNISLAGDLSLQPLVDYNPSGPTCPTFSPGTTQMLIQATDGGVINGTLNGDDAGTGGYDDAFRYCADSAGGAQIGHDYWYHVQYSATAVTATALPPTTTTITASSATPSANGPMTYTAAVSPTSATARCSSTTMTRPRRSAARTRRMASSP